MQSIRSILWAALTLGSLPLTPTVVYAQESAAQCQQNLGAQLWRNTDLSTVLIGEAHGTNEAPALFAELVCNAVASGLHVLVAVEFVVQDSAALERYVNSAGTETDAKAYFASLSVEWSRMRDGRGSHAMWAMIERLRAFKRAGHALDVATFVSPPTEPSDSQTPYEQALAANIESAQERHQPDLTLVLVGNAHVGKVPVTFGGMSSFQPMAMHMRPESTLSLYISHSGGEAWNCRAMDDCGAFQAAARPAAGVSGLAPGSIVLDPAIRPGFDGVVVLGSVTASTPYMSEAE